MAPVRYRYVSSRDIAAQSPDPIHPSSKQSAIEHYARLQNLVKRQQSKNQTLIQMLVINRWRDHMERRKKLAWKVLVALRLRVLAKGYEKGMGWMEEEGGQLCLVS